MLKVSFKDTEGTKAKTVQVYNNKVTEVSLRGTMKLPYFWRNIPLDIWEWVSNHPSVDAYESILDSCLVIKVKGSSKCQDGDTFDPVIGERIAESKAKIRLYKFMYTLCKKLYKYYFTTIFSIEYYSQKGGMRHYHQNRHGGIYEVMHNYEALLIKESHHLGKLLEAL